MVFSQNWFQEGHKAQCVVHPTPVNLAEAEESIATLSMCLRKSQRELEVRKVLTRSVFHFWGGEGVIAFSLPPLLPGC